MTVRREATLEVCAKECGALCCSTPHMSLRLSEDEAYRLHEIGTGRGMNVIFHPLHTGFYRMYFKEHLGHCPFLDVTRRTCTVYEDRPQTCRKFPAKPEPGCLVWPMTEKEK